MGRSALGAAAKTKTGGVRVTEAQNDYFKHKYGSLGKFLQMHVNAELRKAAEAKDDARQQEPSS